jgi:hypothetical protein
MKRKIKTIVFMFVISLVTFTVATAQEKKSEQKVKIIINDGSGTEVVIDTLITEGHLQDSIRLKDGKIIIIGHPGEDSGLDHSGDSEHMYVFSSSDDNVKHSKTKTVTVVSSDSDFVRHTEAGGNVIVMSSENPGKSGGTVKYKVIADNTHGEGKSADKIIYINKGESPDNEMDSNFDVFVSTDENESTEYSIRSIIAKDGLVVTVEGNDEAKVKELVKEIQKKMGVNPPASEKKETVKTETQKTTKK